MLKLTPRCRSKMHSGDPLSEVLIFDPMPGSCEAFTMQSCRLTACLYHSCCFLTELDADQSRICGLSADIYTLTCLDRNHILRRQNFWEQNAPSKLCDIWSRFLFVNASAELAADGAASNRSLQVCRPCCVKGWFLLLSWQKSRAPMRTLSAHMASTPG